MPTAFPRRAQVFAGYVEGKVDRLPWCETALHAETTPLTLALARMNRAGFLTINSQPRVNAAPSADAVFGWGDPGGHVYQKAYVEVRAAKTMSVRAHVSRRPPTPLTRPLPVQCFADAAHLAALAEAAKRHPSIQFQAVDVEGKVVSNAQNNSACAVTWGVFPGREVLQPTVVDPDAFIEWKTEAFALWLTKWCAAYDDDSRAADVLHEIHDTYFLINVVDNDFIQGDIFAVFEGALTILHNKSSQQ